MQALSQVSYTPHMFAVIPDSFMIIARLPRNVKHFFEKSALFLPEHGAGGFYRNSSLVLGVWHTGCNFRASRATFSASVWRACCGQIETQRMQ